MIQLLALHLTNHAGDIQRSNSDSLTRVLCWNVTWWCWPNISLWWAEHETSVRKSKTGIWQDDLCTWAVVKSRSSSNIWNKLFPILFPPFKPAFLSLGAPCKHKVYIPVFFLLILSKSAVNLVMAKKNNKPPLVWKRDLKWVALS